MQRDQTRCSKCPQRPACLPGDLQNEALAAFEREVIHSRPVMARHTLVKADAPFDALYALRRGALKCLYSDASGHEQVAAFLFPGTVLGLAEYTAPVWASTYVALVDSWVCRIPLSVLTPGLNRRLAKLVSTTLRDQYQFHVMLAHCSTSQRLAALLIRVAERFGAVGEPATRFRLPMLRQDIAHYLGMRQESLSRSFSELRSRGWIRFQGWNVVEICDLQELRRFVDGCGRPLGANTA